MSSIYVLCLWIAISAADSLNGIDSDLYVSGFEIVQLSPLQPKPIEQNLTFQLNNVSYHFTLRPRNAIVTSETNISLVGNVSNKNHNVNVNPKKYAFYNFDGFLTENSTVTITGTVNYLGYFEGYFGLGNDVYFIQPYNNTNGNIEGNFAVNTKVTNVCSENFTDGAKISPSRKSTNLHGTKLSNNSETFTNLHDDVKSNLLDDAIKYCPNKPKILSRRRNVNMDPQLDLQRQLKPPNRPIVGDNALLSKRSTPTNATFLCNLKIIVDPKFFKYVGKSDKNHTEMYVIALMSKVDEIFRGIDFNLDGFADNIGLYIDDLHIYKDTTKEENSEWDPVKFFAEFSQYDFSGACAGFLFTNRQMQTAETVSPSLIKTQLTSPAQGICSTYKSSSLPQSTMDDYGEFISNALPVNFKFGGHYACDNTMISQILHQLGHLFGAPNDEFYTIDDECYKQMKGKRYAMAFPTPSGLEPSHSTYSACSLGAMAAFLTKSSRPCLRSCEGAHCSKPLISTRPNVKILPKNLTASGATGQNTTVMPVTFTNWREMCFTIPDPPDSATIPYLTQFLLIITFVTVYFMK
ncbi:hypothetical protein CHUAL_005288 [Chamberlinius hualienensis]